MPSEQDLRDMFADASAPNTLDAQRIVTRSRRRRLPQQVGAGAIGVLAIVGIGIVVQPSLMSAPPAVTSMDQAVGGEAATTDIKRAPAEKLNLCTAPVAELPESPYGLQLDVAFPESAAVGTDPIPGIVRMTNVGTQTIVGTTAASPAITVSQDGITVWHSNGAMVMSLVTVDLAPGESLEYQASFTPVLCGVDDDMAETFREDLPALPAGDYDLSAAIDFSADESIVTEFTPYVDLVTGPRSTITLS
jgi:hypothetical protein